MLGASSGAASHAHGLEAGYALLNGPYYQFDNSVPAWVSTHATNAVTGGFAASIGGGTQLGGSTDGASTVQPSLALTPLIKV